MPAFDRVARPNSPEGRASHLEEGFIFGWIPCKITALNDPLKLGRVQVKSDLLDDNSTMPNANDGWAWVGENFVENAAVGGSHRLLRVGAQVACIAMMGDPNYLMVIDCIPSSEDAPHPTFDRDNEIYGSATLNGVMTAKNDGNQSRVDSYPHGVTKLVDGGGNITNQTKEGATLGLRQDGTATIENPKAHTSHAPDGEVSQGNEAGAKQTMDSKGLVKMIASTKSELVLDGKKGSIEGPINEIGQLLQQAKALMGEFGPLLDKISEFAQGIGMPNGLTALEDFKDLTAEFGEMSAIAAKIPEAIDVFGKLASADPMKMGELLGPQLDAIAPLSELLPIAEAAFAGGDPIAAISDLIPKLPVNLQQGLDAAKMEAIVGDAIALNGQPGRQTEAFTSAALGESFGKVANVFGTGLAGNLSEIRKILPAEAAPDDFLGNVDKSVGDQTKAIAAAQSLATTPATESVTGASSDAFFGSIIGAAATGDTLVSAGSTVDIPLSKVVSKGSAAADTAGSSAATAIAPPGYTIPTREERLKTYAAANTGPQGKGIYWNDPAIVKIPLTKALYDKIPVSKRDAFTLDPLATPTETQEAIDAFADQLGGQAALEALFGSTTQDQTLSGATGTDSLAAAREADSLAAATNADPNFADPDAPIADIDVGSYRARDPEPATPATQDPTSPFYRKFDDNTTPAPPPKGGKNINTNAKPDPNRKSKLPPTAPEAALKLESLLPDLLHGNLTPDAILDAAAGLLPIGDQLQGLNGLAMQALSGKVGDAIASIADQFGGIDAISTASMAIGKGQTDTAIAALQQAIALPGMESLGKIGLGEFNLGSLDINKIAGDLAGSLNLDALGGNLDLNNLTNSLNLGDLLKSGNLPDIGDLANKVLPEAFKSLENAIGPGMEEALKGFSGLLDGLPLERIAAIVEAKQHIAEVLTDLRDRGAKILVEQATGALVGPMGKSGLFAGLKKAGLKSPFGDLSFGEDGGAMATMGKMAIASLEADKPGSGGAGLSLDKGAASLASFSDGSHTKTDAAVTVTDGKIKLDADQGVFVGDVDLLGLVRSLEGRIATLQALVESAGGDNSGA